MNNNGKYDWKKLNKSISLIMQQYCGEIKNKQLLKTGLNRLNVLKNEKISQIKVHNPHELIRTLEVLNILTNAELVLLSCLAREASSKHLHFKRSDFPEMDPPELHKFITLRRENGNVVTGDRAIDYYGDLEENYRKVNNHRNGE